MYRLDVRDLSFEAGDAKILHGINLSLRAGELVALLGPSGSGKSTLLRAMTGFRPGRGKVTLSGRDLYAEIDRLKTLIGFVPQDDVVHDGLSVKKTLEYAALLRLPPDMPAPRREAAVRAVMVAVDLAERADVKVRALSGGQRKRVSVAVELLAEPPLLFLDEPTSGLDPGLEEKAMSLFRGLTGPGRLTVVTTHVLASLDLCDLVIIMSRGRLVFVGPPGEAPAFFGVNDVPSVYKVLAKDPPERWAQAFAASPYRARFVNERLAEPLASSPAPRPAPRAEPAAPPPPAKASPEEELARLKAARDKRGPT